MKLIKLDWIRNALKESKFVLELSESHREFINGKKSGMNLLFEL